MKQVERLDLFFEILYLIAFFVFVGYILLIVFHSFVLGVSISDHYPALFPFIFGCYATLATTSIIGSKLVKALRSELEAQEKEGSDE